MLLQFLVEEVSLLAEAGYELPALTPESQRRPVRKRRVGKAVNFFVILTKMTKLLKVAKFMKVFLSFGTMVISVFVYSFSMGLPFAIGFVALLFCHEVGHVVALRRLGIKASLPVFIPFLGAAVFVPKMGDRHKEAYMAFAGPLIGSLCAAVLFLATLAAPGDHPLLMAIAFTALIINLFNLVPISPLDGGRITQAVGPMFKYVGIAALLAITFALQTPGLLVIWVLVLSDLRIKNGQRLALGLFIEAAAVVMMVGGIGTPQPFWVNVVDVVLMSLFNLMFWDSYRRRATEFEQRDDRPSLPKQQRIRWFLAYLALAVALIGAMLFAQAEFTTLVAG